MSLSSFCGDGGLYSEPFSSGLPNLSVCAQHTVLVWVPTLFFLVTFPFFIGQCKRQAERFVPLPFCFLFILKVILTILIAGNSCFLFCYVIFSSDSFATVYYTYPLLWSLVFGGTTVLHFVRLRCGMVTSGVQHLTALLFLLCGAPEMYQWVRKINEGVNVYNETIGILYIVWYVCVFIYSLLLCFVDSRCRKKEKNSSPELDSSFLNRLVLWWFNNIPWIGAKRDLEVDDLFDLNQSSKSNFLTELWEKIWEEKKSNYYLQKSIWRAEDNAKEVKLPSVVHTLFKMFQYEFLLASILKIISDTMQFANPFLLHELLNFVSKDNAPIWQGLALALIMFCSSQMRSLILNAYFYIMFRMGTKIQTALTGAVYRKTLLLSNGAKRSKTVGEIVNVMAIDVERFQMITPQIQQFWSCPYQITFALVYLFITLGYSAIPGVVIMIIFVPLNILSSMLIRNWQLQQMKLKDERTKIVNEVLNGIKVVKLYAWELAMEEYIDGIRQQELVLIKKSTAVRNTLDSFNAASPFLVALFSFGTFVLSSPSHLLTPQIAFVSLTLFNQLRSPMTMIALLINQTVQAVVSNERLKEFLMAEELDDQAVERSDNVDRSPTAVSIENFSATWDGEKNRAPVLEDVSFDVERQQLIAVIGKIGSGKSSLLSALLGEMEKLKGKVKLNGRVAYVPQQAWIQNQTMRDNITFGKPFNKQRYDQVLYACALLPDLKILPNGDQTEIGEKGINLSGGQKARVSLARAVYQNLDVYLMDDPLSAVDAHVGRHIFEKVLGPKGILREKTRILVTHGINFAKQADTIVVLDEGRITEMGSYAELMKKEGDFCKFLEEYKNDDSSSESGDELIDEKEYASIDQVSVGIKKDIERMESTQMSPLQSQISSTSPKTLEEGKDGKLIKKEDVAVGNVKLSVYKQYVKAASYWMSVVFIVCFLLYMSIQVVRSYWLSAWSDDYDPDRPSADPVSNGVRLGVYGGLGLAETFCFFIALFVMVFGGNRASKNLHKPLIHNLMRSPMSFFDTTPVGRILNRCSKDIETIDMMLPLNFRYLIMCFLQVAFTLVVIVISTPIFAVVILPLSVIYFLFLKYYVPTSRQLKRLESVHRSPIFSNFGETIQGAPCIRAFRKVEPFREYNNNIVDTFIRCRYSSLVANRWLAVRLEFIGNCIIFFAALFAVLSKAFGWSDSPGSVGVSISYALNICEVLNFAVRQVSEIEANIVAVERVHEYSVTRTEAEWRILETKPKSSWPEQGVVEFANYSTRYREGLDLILHDITAKVNGGEKIGIVGRTGAGKSSFALALFRMIEPAGGEIVIDGVDVSKIGLHDLRSKITIIPQDPVLFSGSLRFNLDPFEEYTDNQIWAALESAHLKPYVADLPDGLQYLVSEAGENLSVGQRQLVALARALLRNTKVLVLDEATAAVDVTTDALVQETIRTEFNHCTVFTIAHRLNTIIDYDRIMVLDKGQIIEFDTPAALLDNKRSVFSQMIAEANAKSDRE